MLFFDTCRGGNAILLNPLFARAEILWRALGKWPCFGRHAVDALLKSCCHLQEFAFKYAVKEVTEKDD